jgi:ParB family transcriptional regulator, chromosome partitioning protein
MARRRLAPLTGPAVPGVPRAEHDATARPGALPGPAPISRVAADAAGAAALAEMAHALEDARASGRLVVDLALDQVVPDHLSRDRLPVEDDEMAALRQSIRLHGQRTPIEVTPLAGDGPGGALPYGLISGWRRLSAFRALLAETGEARFATIQALVRRPETAADAYVAMVEENEIRVGLSHYERARVAARATARGVFATEDDALRALFATASRPKRSRIRAFLDLYHALDGALRFPAHLPERLGLKLVEAVRAGGAARIAEAIARAEPQDPAAELALLEALVAPAPDVASGAASGAAPEPLLPGVTLEQALRGRTLTLKLRGAGVTPDLAARIRVLLQGLDAA